MKTTSYNAAKEIRLGIWLAVFSIAIFAAFKVKEIQSNEKKIRDSLINEKILANHYGLPSLPIFNTKLTEPTIPEAKIPGNTESSSGNVTENIADEAETEILVVELMTNVKYNADDYVKAELSTEAERWMNNVSFKGVEKENEVFEVMPVSQIEALMNTVRYNARDFVNAEIALETENRVNGSQN